jgi:hypothetical protein
MITIKYRGVELYHELVHVLYKVHQLDAQVGHAVVLLEVPISYASF